MEMGKGTKGIDARSINRRYPGIPNIVIVPFVHRENVSAVWPHLAGSSTMSYCVWCLSGAWSPTFETVYTYVT